MRRRCQIEDKSASTAARSLPVYLSDLANGEEHHEPDHSPFDSAFVNPNRRRSLSHAEDEQAWIVGQCKIGQSPDLRTGQTSIPRANSSFVQKRVEPPKTT